MIEADGDDVLIRVKAVPGASRDEIAGVLGDRLKVRVTAPPEAGAANKAICRLLAKALGVKPRLVAIESGGSSAQKVVRVAGYNPARVADALS
jgi:uncharacterized protein (TIGR00251 family)